MDGMKLGYVLRIGETFNEYANYLMGLYPR